MKYVLIIVRRKRLIMDFRRFDNFLMLCELAKFTSPAMVFDYMKAEGINAKTLYNELDALCFPSFVGL